MRRNGKTSEVECNTSVEKRVKRNDLKKKIKKNYSNQKTKILVVKRIISGTFRDSTVIILWYLENHLEIIPVTRHAIV